VPKLEANIPRALARIANDLRTTEERERSLASATAAAEESARVVQENVASGLVSSLDIESRKADCWKRKADCWMPLTNTIWPEPSGTVLRAAIFNFLRHSAVAIIVAGLGDPAEFAPTV